MGQVGLKAQFGKQLHYIRGKRNLTQEQLAEATELSVDFVSLVERGINAPSFKNVERLAQALGVPVWLLFCPDSISAETWQHWWRPTISAAAPSPQATGSSQGNRGDRLPD